MIGRRSLFGGLLSIISAPVLSRVANADSQRITDERPHIIGTNSFEDLKAYLDGLPNQCIGRAAATCETGDEYQEIIEYGIARPGDEAFVECAVANKMYNRIERLMHNKSGKIYWRTPFEYERRPSYVIVRYDDDRGLCLMDKNWVSLRCYVRFYRAAV